MQDSTTPSPLLGHRNPTVEISAAAYDALVDAVTLAKSESIRGVSALRRRMAQAGHAQADIETALRIWGQSLLQGARPGSGCSSLESD